MNKTPYRNILLVWIIILTCGLFTACKQATSSTLTYDPTDATVRSFAFASIDSMPGLAAARFVVEDLVDTGRIAMKTNDSIAFGTSLKKVIPVIRYNGYPAAAICYLGDTSFLLTGYDTLDFTQTPIRLRVFAANRTDEKWYNILPRVHQVDPDVYHWTTLNSAITTEQSAEQKALTDGQNFYFFTNDGYTMQVCISSDGGATWQQHTPQQLPIDCHVQQLVYDTLRQQFGYLQDTTFYHSQDGIQWTKTELTDGTLRCLNQIMLFQDQLWTMTVNTQDDTYALSTFDSQTNTLTAQHTIDRNAFPYSDFSVTYIPVSQHTIVTGGYTLDGAMTNACWAFEASSQGYRIVRMNGRSSQTAPFAGSAIVWYGNRLMRIGGIDTDHQPLSEPMYSENEGMTWNAFTDTLHPVLPDNYGKRWNLSAFTRDNQIYLFGGQSTNGFHTDAYQGYLTSIDW